MKQLWNNCIGTQLRPATVEQYSIEFCEAKTSVKPLASQKGHRLSSEPITSRSQYMWLSPAKRGKTSESESQEIGHFRVPLCLSVFQSESKSETILLKMTLICMKIKLHVDLVFIWKVSHLDRLVLNQRHKRTQKWSIGFGLSSDWMKKWREYFKSIAYRTKRNQ